MKKIMLIAGLSFLFPLMGLSSQQLPPNAEFLGQIEGRKIYKFEDSDMSCMIVIDSNETSIACVKSQ